MFVPNCSSGYRSSKEQVSLFKALADPNRLVIWDRAIPRFDRELQPGDCVCENHSSPFLISKTYYVEHEGNVLLNSPKRSVLSAGGAIDFFLTVQSTCPVGVFQAAKAPKKRTLVFRRTAKRRFSQIESSVAAVVDTSTPPKQPCLRRPFPALKQVARRKVWGKIRKQNHQ